MKFDWLQTLNPFRSRLSTGKRVLALTGSLRERTTLHEIAAEHHWQLRFAMNLAEATQYLRQQPIGVILCDRDVGSDWRDYLAGLRSFAPNSCVLLLSGVNDDYLWEEVIRYGGYDVLTKPLQASQVVPAVTLAWSYLAQIAIKK